MPMQWQKSKQTNKKKIKKKKHHVIILKQIKPKQVFALKYLHMDIVQYIIKNIMEAKCVKKKIE